MQPRRAPDAIWRVIDQPMDANLIITTRKIMSTSENVRLSFTPDIRFYTQKITTIVVLMSHAL